MNSEPIATVDPRGESAITSFDETAMRRQITETILDRGVVHAWTSVVFPALTSASESAATLALAEWVTGVFSTTLVDAPVGRGGRTMVAGLSHRRAGVLPGAADGLECRVLAAALATSGVNTRLVLAVDRRALLTAVGVERPDVVVLWLGAGAQDSTDGLCALVRSLRRRCGGVEIVLGGCGTETLGLPRSVHMFETLGAAVAGTRSVAHRVRTRMLR